MNGFDGLSAGKRQDLGLGFPEGVHRVMHRAPSLWTATPSHDLWAIDPTTLFDILSRTEVQEALLKPGTVKRLQERYGDAAVGLIQ